MFYCDVIPEDIDFVNLMQLYIICEKPGGLHQAELGFTEGRQSVRKADKIWARFEIMYKSLL